MTRSAIPCSRWKIRENNANNLDAPHMHKDASTITHDRPRVWALFFPFLLFLLLIVPNSVGSQEVATESANRIKAAFLRNFARYVIWPDQTFADSHTPWRICILGRNPFNHVLDATLVGRTEQGRAFEIYRAETLEDAPPCQMVYITYDIPAERHAALEALKGKPVLTIGDANDFLNEGGIIQFRIGERVQISINLDQAKAGSLGIQTKMLEVAAEVRENGKMRKAR